MDFMNHLIVVYGNYILFNDFYVRNNENTSILRTYEDKKINIELKEVKNASFLVKSIKVLKNDLECQQELNFLVI